ncbi:MFS transporter [Spirillospora sp. NBC_00431]
MPLLAFVVLCAAQFMLIVDVVVLNVALPSLQDSLGIPAEHLQFAGTAYTLTFGSLLIVAGRAGDLFGRRRIFQTGLLIFTLASALAALAQEGWHLFAARALQGVGAALVSPTAMALVTSLFEGERRNRALGVWAAIGSGGAIAGQLLGGVLTDVFGWRSIFLINLPVGVAGALLAGRLLPESRGSVRPTLDGWGAALLAACLAAFSVALTGSWLSGLAAAVLFLAFCLYERRRDEPLVRFALLRDGAVRTGNAVLALIAGTTAIALFFTTLYLQNILGHSATRVGMAFAPVTAIVLVVSPYAGRLVGRLGVRPLMLAGTALSAAGLAHLSFMDASGGYLTDVLPGLALVALGNGVAFAPTMIAATSVGPSDAGAASGLLNTSQELGTAIVLASLAPVAAAVYGAGTVPSDLTDGYQAGLWAASALTVAALLIALGAPKTTGRSTPVPKDHPAAPAPVTNGR